MQTLVLVNLVQAVFLLQHGHTHTAYSCALEVHLLSDLLKHRQPPECVIRAHGREWTSKSTGRLSDAAVHACVEYSRQSVVDER